MAASSGDLFARGSEAFFRDFSFLPRRAIEGGFVLIWNFPGRRSQNVLQNEYFATCPLIEARTGEN